MQGRHRYGPEAIGYFIVSGAAGADDVLAALLLARWAVAYDKRSGEVALDIAPQFETAAASERCGETLRCAAGRPAVPPPSRGARPPPVRTDRLLGQQQGGRSRAPRRFTIYQAQRELAQVLGSAGEQPVLFHARGGSMARGGGRIEAIVRAAPAGAVDGVLRIREQGETVKQGYGLRPIAMRTLERAFNALSLTTSARRSGRLPPDDAGHLECAATLAAASADAYRRLVYDEPQFDELLPAGDADRRDRAHADRRRARCTAPRATASTGLLPVPWVFAWTQTRHMLPGWFGAGAGLRRRGRARGLARLREAARNWFFLRNLVDDVETMLARADLDIAHTTTMLVPQGCARFLPARSAPSTRAPASRCWPSRARRSCWTRDPTLQRSIRLRNPYVDPMNLMQVDLLRRWRAERPAGPRSVRGAARQRRRHRARTAEHRMSAPPRPESPSAPSGPHEVPLVLAFIRELAVYEQLEDQVVATEADLAHGAVRATTLRGSGARLPRGRAGRVRAVLPQFLDLPRQARHLPGGPVRASGGARRRRRPPPARAPGAARAASAAAAGSSGRCSTGTSPRSASTAAWAPRRSMTGRRSASAAMALARLARGDRAPAP